MNKFIPKERVSQERQSRIKTEGSSPAPPFQQDMEWFRTVMPILMYGLPSVVDDDFIENKSITTNQILNGSQEQAIDLSINIRPRDLQADEQENINPNENIMCTVSDSIIEGNMIDSNSPASLLGTPVSKPLRVRKRTHSNSCHDLKYGMLKKVREYEENIYKLKLEHMQEKRNEEREIFELKKRKLLLEISLLENKS